MDLREIAHAECTRFGVPGAAVTAVAGGETVLADGFGLRNGSDPVTPRTLFMLASDTKCFAAATLCLLVEEGRLDLDAPVQHYLPWFAMHDERVSGWVTTRDLLAHRTGLPRHSLMTIGDGSFVITNEDLARRMRYLEASRPFRQGFGYCNAHYAVAGHVAEVLAGKPWKQILADLLGSLRMTGTSTYDPALTTGDFASPHAADGTQLPFQTRAYDLPSGGIVIHAEDLSRWLLARLGGGRLSAPLLRMLHTPVVVSGEELPFPELHAMGYALGNLAFSYRGHRMQLHGGNQIGFASQVIVLPDAQVGVAVTTNVHGSLLPMALGLSLVDRLLGLEPVPWGERLAAAPSAPAAPAEPSGSRLPSDLSAYTGLYTHPAYGDFAVSVDAGALRPSFHGLDGDLRLSHVGEHDWLLSHDRFAELRVPVSFRLGPDGATEAALALEPELAPIVFPRR